MTKLEQKLIELGYGKMCCDTCYKRFNDACLLVIKVSSRAIYGYIKYNHREFFCQVQLNDLQQAFNTLQSDLKELKEYE